MEVIRRKPSWDQFRQLWNRDTNRVRAIIPVDAGDLCNGLEWLNDYADECLLPENCATSLSDLGYKVVGLDEKSGSSNYIDGTLLLEVDALIEDDDFIDDLNDPEVV